MTWGYSTHLMGYWVGRFLPWLDSFCYTLWFYNNFSYLNLSLIQTERRGLNNHCKDGLYVQWPKGCPSRTRNILHGAFPREHQMFPCEHWKFPREHWMFSHEHRMFPHEHQTFPRKHRTFPRKHWTSPHKHSLANVERFVLNREYLQQYMWCFNLLVHCVALFPGELWQACDGASIALHYSCTIVKLQM